MVTRRMIRQLTEQRPIAPIKPMTPLFSFDKTTQQMSSKEREIMIDYYRDMAEYTENYEGYVNDLYAWEQAIDHYTTDYIDDQE